MSFRIYYSDDSIFEGKPEDAPAEGVIVIAMYHPDGERCLLNGWDWYLYCKDEGWYGCDIHGLLDHLKTQPLRWYALKQGRSIASHKFKEMMNRADREWPHRR